MAAAASRSVPRDSCGSTPAGMDFSRRSERRLRFQRKWRFNVLLLTVLAVLLQATSVGAYCNNECLYSCTLWIFCSYGNPTYAKTVGSGSSCNFVHWKHQLYTDLTVHGTMVFDNAGTTYPHLQANNLYVSTTGKISAVGKGYGAQSGSGPVTSGGSEGTVSFSGRDSFTLDCDAIYFNAAFQPAGPIYFGTGSNTFEEPDEFSRAPSVISIAFSLASFGVGFKRSSPMITPAGSRPATPGDALSPKPMVGAAPKIAPSFDSTFGKGRKAGLPKAPPSLSTRGKQVPDKAPSPFPSPPAAPALAPVPVAAGKVGGAIPKNTSAPHLPLSSQGSKAAPQPRKQSMDVTSPRESMPRVVTPTPRGVTPTPRGVTPTPRGVTPTPRGVTPTPRGATLAPREGSNPRGLSRRESASSLQTPWQSKSQGEARQTHQHTKLLFPGTDNLFDS